MEENSSMYREEILDLYKNPLNKGILKNPTHRSKKINPLCGDELEMQLIIEKNKVKDVKFSGAGCAISIASASLLTESIKKKDMTYIKNLNQKDMMNLLGININPARMKCALISLETLKEAIKNNKK